MSYQSPIGRARGLGSAGDGTEHWWVQRMTAVALVPLCVWFVFSLTCVAGSELPVVIDWISQPFSAIMLILFISTALYHSQLGLQVVIEDYVGGATKVVTMALMKFAHVALAVAALFAILKIALGDS